MRDGRVGPLRFITRAHGMSISLVFIWSITSCSHFIQGNFNMFLKTNLGYLFPVTLKIMKLLVQINLVVFGYDLWRLP